MLAELIRQQGTLSSSSGTNIQEVRRRERIIRIFPNESSALRLMGALLAEIHEEWQSRRYLDMTEFHEWATEQPPSSESTVVAIN